MSLSVVNQPAGSTVECLWKYTNTYSQATSRSGCSFTPTQRFTDGALTYIVSVKSGGRVIWTSGEQSAGRVTLRSFAAGPSISLASTGLVNQPLSLTVTDVPEGANFSCTWLFPNGYSQTSEINRCSFTPDRTFRAGEIRYVVKLTKEDYFDWSSGEVPVDAVGRSAFLQAPTITLSGERYIDSTLTLSVTNVEEGASIRCTWFFPNGYSQTSEVAGCSHTPTRTLSAGALRYVVEMTKPDFTTWRSGEIPVEAITLRPPPPPPSVNLSGEFYVGSQLRLNISDVPEGSTVRCTWYYPNNYSQISEVAGCAFTPNSSFRSGEVKYLVTVTKTGTATWSSGQVPVSAITLRPMVNTPVFSLVGDRFEDSPLRVEVGTVDEGVTIRCSWESLGSYSNTVFSSSCSYTPTRRFSSGGLNVRVIVSKTGFASWSSGWVNVGPITTRPAP
jgi:uncharacterized protein YodC (DUF2158 family)